MRASRFVAILIAICAIGVVLRLFVYAANLSLWLDEAYLALNILRRDYGELLEPLWWDQGAPPAFLFAEKAVVDVLGDAEWAFRLVPLLVGLAAVGLFALLARRVLGTGATALFAVALFALSVPLARYSAEIKQYGLDVFIAIVVALVALRLVRTPPAPAAVILFGVAGGVLTLVSFTAALVTAGMLLAIIAAAAERRDRGAALSAIGIGIAGLAAGLAYLRWVAPPGALRERVVGEFRASELNPVDTISRYLQLTGAEFAWAGAATGVLALAGIVGLALRDRPTLWFLSGPFVAALAADAAGLYPFYQRFSLFSVPFALLLVAAGARAIGNADAVARVPALGLSAVALAGFATHATDTLAHGPGWDSRQDLRPVLSEVAEARADGDTVWIYPGARFAFAYYAPRLGLPVGPPGPGVVDVSAGIRFPEPITGAPPEVVIGTPFGSASDLRADLSALRGESGRRVWVVFSNVLPLSDESNPEGALFAHLESIGTWRDSTERFNASWYLFELDPVGG